MRSANVPGFATFEDATRDLTGDPVYAGTAVSDSPSQFDAALVAIDATGAIAWQGTYGGSPGTEYALAVQPTTDTGFILVGGTESYGPGNPSLYVVKTDPVGVTGPPPG